MAALAAALIAGIAAPARAEPTCAPVSSTVQTTIIPCPNGEPTLCTTGDVSGDGLNGSTFFILTGGEIRGVNQYFEGIFVVFTEEGGTLTFATRGMLNMKTGRYTETFVLEAGDDTGRLVSVGSATPTGFAGAVYGALCTTD